VQADLAPRSIASGEASDESPITGIAAVRGFFLTASVRSKPSMRACRDRHQDVEGARRLEQRQRSLADAADVPIAAASARGPACAKNGASSISSTRTGARSMRPPAQASIFEGERR